LYETAKAITTVKMVKLSITSSCRRLRWIHSHSNGAMTSCPQMRGRKLVIRDVDISAVVMALAVSYNLSAAPVRIFLMQLIDLINYARAQTESCKAVDQGSPAPARHRPQRASLPDRMTTGQMMPSRHFHVTVSCPQARCGGSVDPYICDPSSQPVIVLWQVCRMSCNAGRRIDGYPRHRDALRAPETRHQPGL